MEIRELRDKMYRYVMERRDFNKIDKMIDGIEKGKINKDNFWDNIGKLTRKVYSDHSLGRWQCLAECLYELI